MYKNALFVCLTFIFAHLSCMFSWQKIFSKRTKPLNQLPITHEAFVLACNAVSEALWTSAFYAIWNYATGTASSRHQTSASLIGLGLKVNSAKRLYVWKSCKILAYGIECKWKYSLIFGEYSLWFFENSQRILRE